MAADTLMQMYEEKCERSRATRFGKDVQVDHSGFVRTTRGAVLTSKEALDAARKKALRI